MKNIQITEELFIQLVKFHLLESNVGLENIKQGLEEKLQKVINHTTYTNYKTAKTPEEREAARQEYLNRIGCHKDFRW